MEIPVREDSGPVSFLGVGGGAPVLYGVGWCRRLRNSQMSGMSRSSGPWLPVFLAFVSGMHVFPRRMPPGQACLSGMFCVFEVQSFLLNLGPMFVHCLKLCQLPGRPCPTAWFSLFFTISWSSPCGKQSKEVSSIYSSHNPHAWIFSLALEFLFPYQSGKSSSSWAVALSPGLSAH